MAGRSTRVLGAVGAALVALVLAHSLVFLVRYGSAYGEALAHNGHDLAWSIAVWSAAILGSGLAIAGVFQLSRLSRAASAIWPVAVRATPPAGPGLVRRWLGTSGRLAVLTAVLLTIQENVERSGLGLPAPGPGLLVSGDYPWAVAIVIAVSLAIGLVVALFRVRREALLVRIRAAGRAQARTAPDAKPNVLHHRPAASVLGQARGLRAPPVAFDS
jgi:hypothetical protein